MPIEIHCKGLRSFAVMSGRRMFSVIPSTSGSTSISPTVIATDTGSIAVARKISRVGA